MFKHYRNFQAVQYRWIRKHPFQWIALNVILTLVFIAYIEYKDRKETREMFENETPITN